MKKILISISVILVGVIGFVLWGDASKTEETLSLWQRIKNFFGTNPQTTPPTAALATATVENGNKANSKTITEGQTATYYAGTFYGLHVNVRDGEGTIAIGGGSAIPINTSLGYSMPKSEKAYNSTVEIVCTTGTIDIIVYT